MRHRGILIAALVTIFLLVSACQAAPADPPPTLQAVATTSNLLDDVAVGEVEILQDRPFGSGQMLLYRWRNELGESCLAATYLTNLDNELRPHDTMSAGCQAGIPFTAAYTGNSQLETLFGPPRYTTVYGTSESGEAVRIIWTDGQVNHVPLQNGSFLETRSGRWHVERIELLDGNNDLLLAEELRRTN